MSFEKELKKATGTIKSGSQRMISSDYLFHCAIADIFRKDRIHNPETNEQEDTMVFPTNEELTIWMWNLFEKDLATKALPAKALENMKKRGISPKKPPGEILNIIVAASNTTNLILVHHPGKDALGIDLDVGQLIEEVMDGTSFEMNHTATDYVVVVEYDEGSDQSPYKERDVILRNFFTALKKTSIYPVESDSEEESDEEENEEEESGET